MANPALLRITIDDDVIRSWAQRREARPSTYEGDEPPWPLKFSSGATAAGLVEISWDRFFAEFEAADLAFVCRGPNGELDDFYEFVSRSAVAELIISGRSTIVEQAI